MQAKAPGSPPEEHWTAQDGLAVVLPPGLTDLELQDALQPYRHIKIWWCVRSQCELHTHVNRSAKHDVLRTTRRLGCGPVVVPQKMQRGVAWHSCACRAARAFCRFADAAATFKVRGSTEGCGAVHVCRAHVDQTCFHRSRRTVLCSATQAFSDGRTQAAWQERLSILYMGVDYWKWPGT